MPGEPENLFSLTRAALSTGRAQKQIPLLNAAAGRVETFALSRWRSFDGTGEHFEGSSAFDARAFFRGAFGISQAERPWRVRLVLSREVATYAGERVWHPTQRMRRRRDGALELRLETSSRKQWTRWILSVGSLCEGGGSAATAATSAGTIAGG